MDYKTHFNFLLEYDFWANNVVMELIKSNGLNTGRPTELLSHIINAEVLIMGRIRGEEFFDPFMVRSIEENIKLSKSIKAEWKEYINNLAEVEFDNSIRYVNIRGERVTAKIWEMFMHMINHSTYHRGQIALILRKMNISPPITDLMTFAMSEKN